MKICKVDYRDEEGWVYAADVCKIIPRNLKAISRVLCRRVEIKGHRRAPRKKDRPDLARQAVQYLLDDQQWQDLVDYGAELRMIGHKISRAGWHATQCTCEDGAVPIRLWYRIDDHGYPLAWQWREETERRWVAPDVETLREAMDQLLGESPIGLCFSPRYRDYPGEDRFDKE